MTFEAVAERVARGEPLDATDARSVLESYDLIAIGMMGDEVRRRMRGVQATFVRVFEVHTEVPPASAPQGVTAGEFRIVGRPATLDRAVDAIRAARALAGNIPVAGYSMRDVLALAPVDRGAAALFSKLKEAGLDAIAELAVDDDVDVVGAVRAARAAGLVVARLTVTTWQGVDDTVNAGTFNEERIATIVRARDLQETLGGFHAFAPLPRTVSVTMPTTGYDDVKQVALARLIVTNIESIQVDWALYGPKLAQVGLTVGADDVDNVAAIDAGVLGVRRSPLEEIRRNIRAASFEPVERDGLFRVT